jgi:hypothetical protein
VWFVQRYEDTKDDAEFFKDFINKTDNGRSSTRIADAFGLKITTIALVKKSNSVRLFLQPQEVLKSIGESVALLPHNKLFLLQLY